MEEQLGYCVTAVEPVPRDQELQLLSPCAAIAGAPTPGSPLLPLLSLQRSHCSEKASHCNGEWPSLASTGEKPVQ